jgi:hypothetical protein
METLAERLNFSLKNEHELAVKIDKWRDISYYDTLCKYCADNDINIMMYSATDFDNAVETLRTYGQDDKSFDLYYFWIS